MLRALVAGHVCIDLIPDLAGPVDVTPGGLVDVGPSASLRRVPGRNRLPRYTGSAIAAARVDTGDGPGWELGRPGVFTARADRPASGGREMASGVEERSS
jgi:hypothetical protein